ncbi:acetate/propionate family kinase [Guggenheimella bovis]
MKVLVINCGSSSLKFQLLNMDTKELMASGLVERIGIDGSVCTLKTPDKEKHITKTEMPDHSVALNIVLNELVNPKYNIIQSLEEIDAVGHRVVHGAEKYARSVVVDEDVMKSLEECTPLAPLHNPANILGIRAIQKLLPKVQNVAVFDTAFHQTMPKEAFLYALPLEMYTKHGVRRYGFHGTSHKFVAEHAASFLGKDLKDLKLITCHLGNGASVTAIEHGKSIDTSMGLTPLEGLVMGTRCGDLDPAVILFIMEKEGLSFDEMDHMMNKESGILGLSGVSSDFRDVEEAAANGNVRAQDALKVYRRTVTKYIGSYAAIMDGPDAIVFTGGLGENSAIDRMEICKTLGYMGVTLDPERNKKRGEETLISTDDSKVKVLLIPTNEELAIAMDTVSLLK